MQAARRSALLHLRDCAERAAYHYQFLQRSGFSDRDREALFAEAREAFEHAKRAAISASCDSVTMERVMREGREAGRARVGIDAAISYRPPSWRERLWTWLTRSWIGWRGRIQRVLQLADE